MQVPVDRNLDVVTDSLIFKLQYLFRNHCSFYYVSLVLLLYVQFQKLLEYQYFINCFSLLLSGLPCPLCALTYSVGFISSNWTARKVSNIVFEDFDLMNMVWPFFIHCLCRFFKLDYYFQGYLIGFLTREIIVTYGIWFMLAISLIICLVLFL